MLMKIKFSSDLKNVARVLFLFAGLMVIAQCNTSNKVASSFDQRKYTPGHFSLPTAKINRSSTPASSDGDADISDQSVHVRPSDKRPSYTVANSSGSNLKAHTTAAIPRFILAAQKKLGFNLITTASQADNENGSLKKSPSTKLLLPYNPHGDYMREDVLPPHAARVYLTAWLVCLGVAVIFWLLFLAWATQAASGASNPNTPSYDNSGCTFLLIGTLASIAAVVLFILWIVALATT